MFGFWHWLHEWQDLTSGLLSFAAGGGAIFFLWRQIKGERVRSEKEHKRHEETIYRKSLTARAQMPDALSALSIFTENCFAWLGDAARSKPTLPTTAMETLKSGIEYADSKTALAIFELVSFYQVHNARLFGERDPWLSAEFSDHLYDTAKLRALSNRLYPYARNQEPTVDATPLTQSEMLSALRTGAHLEFEFQLPDQFGEVQKIIERRHT